VRLCFFASDKDREQELARAFIAGAQLHGVDCEIRPLGSQLPLDGIDVAVMVGVKSRDLWRQAIAAGALPVMVDKGYSRHRRDDARVWEYWRVSFGAHHPTRTTLHTRNWPATRAESFGWQPKPWREDGHHIVIAGSSAKYHAFYGLPDPGDYTRALVRILQDRTDRPIIYRPKPSYREALPIAGADFSQGAESLADTLDGAWALVTHGSNACFEAALLGIPSIVLGDGVMAPISSRNICEISEPKCGKRERIIANLAWHQWTLEEFREGQMWSVAGGWLDGALQTVR
jgi:hypothetical protein